MPDGSIDSEFHPTESRSDSCLIWTGKCAEVDPPGAYLQYNEVCHVLKLLHTYRTGRLSIFSYVAVYRL